MVQFRRNINGSLVAVFNDKHLMVLPAVGKRQGWRGSVNGRTVCYGSTEKEAKYNLLQVVNGF